MLYSYISHILSHTLRVVRIGAASQLEDQRLSFDCSLHPGQRRRYGLEGPGIESRWGRDFSQLSRRALGPTHPPIQWLPGLSCG